MMHWLVKFRVFVGLGGLAVVVAGLALLNTAVPAPPVPDDLQQSDVLVRQRIMQAVKALEDNPRELTGWLELAHVYHANGYLEPAGHCYKHVLEQQADHQKALYGLALMAYEAGRLDRACEIIERIVTSGESYAPALWRRAMWLIDDGRLNQAERDIKQAGRIAPESRNAVIVQAHLHLVKDNAEDAVSILEPHVTSHREDRYAYQLLGRAYRRLGRADDALIATARGKGAHLTLDDPWYGTIMAQQTGLVPERKRADALHARGEIKRAIRLYENLHDHFPRNPTVATNLALAYANAGRLSSALDVLDDVRRYADSSVDQARIEFRTADVYFRQGDFTRALQAADRSIERHAELGVNHRLRAAALFELGRRDEAMGALDDAVRYTHDDATPALYRGRLQESLGDRRGAIESFRLAVQREPLLVEAWLALAMAHAREDEFDNADYALAMAKRAAPDAENIPRVARQILELKIQHDGSTQPAGPPDLPSQQ